jgi:hypothetical protein
VAGAVAFAFVQLDLLRMSSGVFRFGTFEDPQRVKLAFYRDGKTASIAVTDNSENGRRSIRTNGKTDAAITMGEGARGADESTMTLAAAIPLAMKPRPRRSPTSASDRAHDPRAPRQPARDRGRLDRDRTHDDRGREALPPAQRPAYEDPRSHIHIDDAKTFFASRGKRYDIIVSEPSNPWVSGVSTLYSHEFYGQVSRHLKDDGLFVQWVQSYDIGLDLISTVFKALGSRFGDYVVYRVGTVDLLIVATPGRALPGASRRRLRLSRCRVGPGLPGLPRGRGSRSAARRRAACAGGPVRRERVPHQLRLFPDPGPARTARALPRRQLPGAA